MNLFILFSLLISLAAFFSFINEKWLHFPSGIALMLMSALLSIGLILIGGSSHQFTVFIREQLATIDFPEFILGILLSFLLFAGSLHTSYSQLKNSAVSIITFSTL